MAKKRSPKPKPVSAARSKKSKPARATKALKKATSAKTKAVSGKASKTKAKKATEAKAKAGRRKIAKPATKVAKTPTRTARAPQGRQQAEQHIKVGRPQRTPAAGPDSATKDPVAEQKQKRSFAQQAKQAQQKAQPNELHPGQTAQEGRSHDRPGSQLERMRHLYPNGNRPNSGGARSTQYKGKRRDNMSQGGE